MLYLLTVIALILLGLAAALWLRPALGMGSKPGDMRFGLHEGLELVGEVNRWGNVTYVVKDADGNLMFSIPVRNCILDVRFRNGRLRFRENGTGREGYIDNTGHVAFTDTTMAAPAPAEAAIGSMTAATTTPAAGKDQSTETPKEKDALRRTSEDNPFFGEAAKILSGKLDETDASRRRVILGWCGRLRSAYNDKNISFLQQVFSDRALIIVGNVVKTAAETDGQMASGERVKYFLRTKQEYLDRLSRAFSAGGSVSVEFSSFRIMRHPTMDGIYGVTLRQRYSSRQYSDDGWLFLLWDFRHPDRPLIHVRTWQPASAVGSADDVINISDFNLE